MGTFSKLEALHSETSECTSDRNTWVARDPRARSTRPHEMFPPPCAIDRKEIAGLLAKKTVSLALVSNNICLFEAFLVLIVGAFSYLIFVTDRSPWAAALIIAAMALMFLSCAQALRLYMVQLMRDIAQQMVRLVAAWFSCFVFLMVTSQMFPQIMIFDPVWMAPWFVGVLAALTLERFFLTSLVRRWSEDGLLERRAVIVGGGKEAEELITNLERQPANDIRICGIFDDRNNQRSPALVAGYPKLGTIPELVEFARDTRLDMLIVALPLTAGGRVREMLTKLWILPVDIRLSAHTNKMAFKPRNYSYIGAIPFIRLADRPITGWNFIQKRMFDAIVSALLLMILSPLMILTAIAIKCDSKGPVFFRQKRHGFNNEVIDVWKFRSMYTDQCDAAAKVVVTKGDPRVTKVGAFIRKTSIDELPQLWNVLKGELSLVGPRPHAVAAHVKEQPWNDVVDGYYARHRVKPGVTGWAQINGWRGEVDNVQKIKKRTDYDLYYIENWSLAFDLYILALTPLKLLDTKNAY